MAANNPPAGHSPASSPSAGEPLDLATSVAGEEDPGASIDMVPAAPAATRDTAHNVCLSCGGTGLFQGMGCPECEGTGKVAAGISVRAAQAPNTPL